MAAMDRVVRFLFINRYLVLIALLKAAIAGAGLALAALASIDIAIAVMAKETWDAWQVDKLISQFALVGAGAGVVWQLVKTIFLR